MAKKGKVERSGRGDDGKNSKRRRKKKRKREGQREEMKRCKRQVNAEKPNMNQKQLRQSIEKATGILGSLPLRVENNGCDGLEGHKIHRGARARGNSLKVRR